MGRRVYARTRRCWVPVCVVGYTAMLFNSGTMGALSRRMSARRRRLLSSRGPIEGPRGSLTYSIIMSLGPILPTPSVRFIYRRYVILELGMAMAKIMTVLRTLTLLTIVQLGLW